MNKAIKTSRKEFSKHTPKIETIKVDKKDIATVIGKGGATIREIVETSGAKVDVKDTGIECELSLHQMRLQEIKLLIS